MINVAHHSDDRSTRREPFGFIVLTNVLMRHLLFERDHLNDPAEGFGEACSRLNIESLIDAGENAAVEEILQQLLRANVQLFGELTHGDAFGDGDWARLANNWRRGRFRMANSAPCGSASARADRMQFTFTFGETFFNCRFGASRRLAHVKRLARLRFRGLTSGTGGSSHRLAGTATAAGTLRRPHGRATGAWSTLCASGRPISRLRAAWAGRGAWS